MTYLLINLTSYGVGYSVVGTFKSKKRAMELRKKLTNEEDIKTGNSWTVLPVEPMDKYTDESILDYARSK